MKVIDENAHQWVVECEQRGCHNKIGVPKRIKVEGKTMLIMNPAPRRCIDHPPPPK